MGAAFQQLLKSISHALCRKSVIPPSLWTFSYFHESAHVLSGKGTMAHAFCQVPFTFLRYFVQCHHTRAGQSAPCGGDQGLCGPAEAACRPNRPHGHTEPSRGLSRLAARLTRAHGLMTRSLFAHYLPSHAFCANQLRRGKVRALCRLDKMCAIFFWHRWPEIFFNTRKEKMILK